MANYDYDIGILGAGAAGLTVTAGAAQLGAKTILIEKASELGGDCLHFGCVPSKTLIKTASVYHHMKNGPRYGLPSVEAPPVDFAQIAARIRSVISDIQKHDSVERFCGLGAQVEFGEARFLDEHQVQLNGRNITARNWVVATGSSPSAPPVPGLDQTSYITNKEIFSLDRLPESMIILGAGPIAVEMAQTFCRLGTKVTVIQRSGQILSREDKDMADAVMKVLEEEGVEFYLNTSVKGASEAGSIRELTIEDAGGQEVKLTAKALLVALGRSANAGELGLEAAGVEYTPRGITTDKRLKTTQKHIFAAGDDARGGL